MKYLITGGAGFIGSTLANHLITSGNQVVIVDNLSMGKVTNLNNNNNLKFVEGSVSNRKLMESIIKNEKFDYIFHLAAIASVADSVERPVETHIVNFDSTLLLLELIKMYQKNLKKFVFSSSAAVYGDGKNDAIKEDDVINPMTPYAIDKFASERYALSYFNLYDVPTAAVRFFNVYGPMQNPNSPYSGVLSILLEKYSYLSNGRPESFTLFGDGTQTRDFVYIEDVISALLCVAESDYSLGKVYNVGTGKTSSLNEIISIINGYLNVEIPVNYEPIRSGDIQHSLADISLIKNIGFSPKYDVHKGLKKYLDFLNNKHLISGN